MLVRVFYVLLVCVFFSTTIHAKTYIREYTYKASEADSKLSSRTIALDQVKVLLLQEIGTHIRQKISIAKDSSGNTKEVKIYREEIYEGCQNPYASPPYG